MRIYAFLVSEYISLISFFSYSEPTIKGVKMSDKGRILIYIPIVHTQADMGSLQEPIRQATVRNLGKKCWDDQVHWVDELWTEIEEAVENLDVPFDKVRLYQDGLPECGREIEIVKELARMGNRNYVILLRLIEKGATLMGTESPELLLKEYERIKMILSLSDTSQVEKDAAHLKESGELILKERDKFIANRINTTLQPGETGILFLGMLHSLTDYLDKNIQIVHQVFKSAKQ